MKLLSSAIIQMENAENYLKMCIAAIEVQQCKYDYMNEQSVIYRPNLPAYPTNTEIFLAEKIWLPSMEESLKIYTAKCGCDITDSTTLLWLADFINDKSKVNDYFVMFPMKEMVALCFVMEKVFRKTWRGSYDTQTRVLSGEWVDLG